MFNVLKTRLVRGAAVEHESVREMPDLVPESTLRVCRGRGVGVSPKKGKRAAATALLRAIRCAIFIGVTNRREELILLSCIPCTPYCNHFMRFM